MFQDRTVVKTERATVSMPVILTLADGEVMKGAISVPRNGRLGDVLNGENSFILFETNGGEPIYLSRNSIAAVQSNDMPKAPQLKQARGQIESASPYKILHVEPGVDKEGLRNAYHRLVKHYHPDQFASTPLPREVRAYLDAVILRLNAAYQQVEDEIDRLEEARLRQQQPQKAAASNIRFFGQ